MIPTSQLESLALTLYDIGAIALGEFRLHSGRLSPIYIDLRLLASFPKALRETTAVYQHLLHTLTFDLLVATPLAGLPIGTALCLAMDKPLIFPRKTAKGYGTGKQIEGKWQAGQTAVVIDDLITSGDSILQTVKMMETAELHVTDAVVLIDREQGGMANVRAAGIQMHALITLSQIFDVLQKHNHLTPARRQEIIQALGIT